MVLVKMMVFQTWNLLPCLKTFKTLMEEEELSFWILKVMINFFKVKMRILWTLLIRVQQCGMIGIHLQILKIRQQSSKEKWKKLWIKTNRNRLTNMMQIQWMIIWDLKMKLLMMMTVIIKVNNKIIIFMKIATIKGRIKVLNL